MFKTNVAVKKIKAGRIRKRIRKKIKGTSDRPRVFLFKSNRYLYLQAVDDDSGRILVSASTLDKDFRTKNKNTKNLEASKALGKIMAVKLKQKKAERIVFDRGIYPYHGRVKAAAEGMREGGLVF